MRRLRATLFGNGYLAATLILLLVAVSSAPAASLSPGTEVGSKAQHEKWLEGLRMVSAGRLSEGAERIRQIVSEGIRDERVQRVNDWLAEFEQLQTDRSERIRAGYDKYAAWVNGDIANFEKDHKRAWWRQAIQDCAWAFGTTEDEDAFRAEPWLVRAIEGATKVAAEYEGEQKWRQAARIYGPLRGIFPFNKSYREAFERCQSHIRLQLVYTNEPVWGYGGRSEWEEAVKDIVPEMARAAFRRIDTDYLREPVFAEAAVAGLDQLLLMAKEPKIAEVFKKLQDKDVVREFCMRIEAKRQQAQEADELDVEDLIGFFERALIINSETGLFPQAVLVHEFVLGALRPLDKFSDMLWPADLADFNKHTQGKFSGVGIQIRKRRNEPIEVISPLEGTPAYEAGIQAGDLITKINGESALKYSIYGAVAEITGPAGTFVRLTIRRPSEDREFAVRLERQEIKILTIKGYERDEEGHWQYMVDPEFKIAYARMTHFTEGTTEELISLVRDLRNQGMRGFIFDLRGNPGGPLKAAVDVSDLFLDADKQIVSTKGRFGKPWVKSSSDEMHYSDFPMIILTNEFSASASEIVAGALQVHGRAMILGERTFGKGSVQQVLPLTAREMACLKLTTAHYYLPDGRCLHREDDSTTWGVDPDVKIKLIGKEMVKVRDLQLKKEILKGKNQKRLSAEQLEALTRYRSSTNPADNESDETYDGADDDGKGDDKANGDEEDEEELELPDREDENTFPEVDPQFEGALLLLRIRLESGERWPTRSTQWVLAPDDA